MAPILERIDHIHIHVSNRVIAEAWYARVLGLRRLPEFEFWAVDGGPLTLSNASGSIHLALFERPRQACHSTIALAVTANEFVAWQDHLAKVLQQPVELADHDASWSLYFADPDGNPFEITCYDHAILASRLAQHGNGTVDAG
jgi:catechol-2,3-dioxygenase